jgi:hypothetical protein
MERIIAVVPLVFASCGGSMPPPRSPPLVGAGSGGRPVVQEREEAEAPEAMSPAPPESPDPPSPPRPTPEERLAVALGRVSGDLDTIKRQPFAKWKDWLPRLDAHDMELRSLVDEMPEKQKRIARVRKPLQVLKRAIAKGGKGMAMRALRAARRAVHGRPHAR